MGLTNMRTSDIAAFCLGGFVGLVAVKHVIL